MLAKRFSAVVAAAAAMLIFVYNGGNWNFDNGVDVYRGTGIYRGGQTIVNYAISQVSHTSC